MQLNFSNIVVNVIEVYLSIRFPLHVSLAIKSLSHSSYLSCIAFSDRFLPDKAIDLIDEAGSRVRLRHAQVSLILPHFIYAYFPLHYINIMLKQDYSLIAS